MLIKIIRYIRGYVRIRVAGNSTERFLNACSHKGIFIWELQPSGGAYEMNLSIREFRRLKPIIRKTGTKMTITGRFGLPFFLHKYRKRRMFFAGAGLCLALICLMSRFIWNIDITGNQTRTDETILKFLESQHVEAGMLISHVDCDRIVKDIRKEYDDIIWVSASIRGTRLMIRVKENEDAISVAGDTDARHAEEQIDENQTGAFSEENQISEPTDIVADCDCVITSIVPRSGIPVVQEGTEVKKGDILISGQVPVVDDAGETIGYQYHSSDADIMGQTTIQYEDTMELTYIEKEYPEAERSIYFLQLGSCRFSFGWVGDSYENREIWGTSQRFRLSTGMKLPIIYGVKTVKPYSFEKRTYTQKEIQQRLSADFQRYCTELDKKGVEIIENSVKIYTGSDTAKAKGTLTVVMPVGTQTPSRLLEIPVIEEQEETGE